MITLTVASQRRPPVPVVPVVTRPRRCRPGCVHTPLSVESQPCVRARAVVLPPVPPAAGARLVLRQRQRRRRSPQLQTAPVTASLRSAIDDTQTAADCYLNHLSSLQLSSLTQGKR